jgi:hypothetical protein
MLLLSNFPSFESSRSSEYGPHTAGAAALIYRILPNWEALNFRAFH